jgi:UDP:flavonoid glycosyltransferase YjiC (YdhE family)
VKLALVASAHGFGHLTRLIAIGEVLRRQGVEPTFFTAAPAALVHETLPGADVRPWSVDVGLVQQDSLTEDVPGTLRLLEARASEAAIDRLAGALSGFDRVASDTAPTALEAARRAGVDAIAVGSFGWDWIYARYAGLEGWAAQFAAWQAPHRALEMWPGPGLTGFRSVERVGLVARTRPAHRVAAWTALASFGGFGLHGLDELLPRIPGLTWVVAPPMVPLDRPDCVAAPGVPYPSLVAGCDVVFTKPGYGILAECIAAGTPIVWAPRGAFPEAPHLEVAMRARGDLRIDHPVTDPPGFRRSLAAALQRLHGRPRPAPRAADGATRVARRLTEKIS